MRRYLPSSTRTLRCGAVGTMASERSRSFVHLRESHWSNLIQTGIN